MIFDNEILNERYTSVRFWKNRTRFTVNHSPCARDTHHDHTYAQLCPRRINNAMISPFEYHSTLRRRSSASILWYAWYFTVQSSNLRAFHSWNGIGQGFPRLFQECTNVRDCRQSADEGFSYFRGTTGVMNFFIKYSLTKNILEQTTLRFSKIILD